LFQNNTIVINFLENLGALPNSPIVTKKKRLKKLTLMSGLDPKAKSKSIQSSINEEIKGYSDLLNE